MIDLRKYGYRCAAAFYRDRNVPMATFVAISQDKSWKIAKRVLYHKDCPIAIRDSFASDPLWYKRFTALFTRSAPSGYVTRALKDKDKRIRQTYLEALYINTWKLLTKLEVL